MIASANFVSSPDPLHARFLALVPRLERHARIYFRHLKCQVQQEDAVQETIALAWKWFRRLVARGKDVEKFPMVFSFLVARAVRCGRRLCGMHKSQDVMNHQAQVRFGFTVAPLPTSTCTSFENLYAVNGQRKLDEFEERLQHNLATPVDEQVQFRLDFRAWLKTLSGRERRIIKAMARNERTKDLARQFELSAARISQLRREFMEDWRRYWSEEPSSGIA